MNSFHPYNNTEADTFVMLLTDGETEAGGGHPAAEFWSWNSDIASWVQGPPTQKAAVGSDF